MTIRASLASVIIFFIISPGLLVCESFAGNLGFGLHAGYGVIKFEEKETFFGNNFESASEQNVIIFGGSGEYSFKRYEKVYVGVTTDWAFGLEDTETQKQGGVEVQTNDMNLFGEFYDLRLGYKNSLDVFYYRLYVSGGWDGLHFERDGFVLQGSRVNKTSTEDISLWRTGIGAGFGYKVGKWAVDGRVAYSYYPEGETKDSSLPQYRFDTEGTCLDAGVGIARSVTEGMNFYLGISYTLQKLRGKPTVNSPFHSILWKSKLEILVGMLNLAYAF